MTGASTRRSGSPACSTAPRRPTTRSPAHTTTTSASDSSSSPACGPGDAVLDVACGTRCGARPGGGARRPDRTSRRSRPLAGDGSPRARARRRRWRRRRAPRDGRGTPRCSGRVVRGGVVRLRDLLPSRSRARAGRVPPRARPRWHARGVDVGRGGRRAGHGRTSSSPMWSSSDGRCNGPSTDPTTSTRCCAVRGSTTLSCGPNSTTCSSPTPTSGGRGSGRTACAGSSNSSRSHSSSACAPTPQSGSQRWPTTVASRSGWRLSIAVGRRA